MRPLRFPTKKPLPKDHWLTDVPGAYDKFSQRIATNVAGIIEVAPKDDPKPYSSKLIDEPLDKLAMPLTSYQHEVLTPPYLNYESIYLKWAGGAGKTYASCLYAVNNWQANSRLLIITTAGAKRQWAAEVSRVTSLFPNVIDVIDETLDEYQEVYIINWDLVAPMEDKLTAYLKSGKATIIYDEIHYGKAYKRVKQEVSELTRELSYEPLKTRAAVAARLARIAHRRIGLSATPYSVSIIDLWSQLDMLEPDCWGKRYADFAFRYCAARSGQHGGLDMTGTSNLDELKMRLKFVMHSVSRQELEAALPGKSRELIRLSGKDLNMPFKNAIQYLKQIRAEGDEDSFWEAQIAVAASMKRTWVVNQIVDALNSDQRIVVLCNRREEVEVLAELAAKNKNVAASQILASHGGSSLDIRESQRIAYRDSTTPLCLIGTHDAWGVSIDGLQSTDIAIMDALPTTPRILGQSETRFVRKGQTRRCRILYPIAEGTIDEMVNERLLSRLDALKDLIEGEEESDLARQTLAGFGDLDKFLDDFVRKF